MAQHDYNIANQGFSSFRSDLNNALSAVQTCNSGTSRPTGAVAGQIWLDTTSATSPTLKYYDGADDISLATLDHTANTVNWLDSTVSITGLTTTATGTVLTLSDSSLTSSVNLILQNQKEIRFSETTANGTNYVGFKAPASLSADKIWVLPTADGTAGQFLKTDGSGNLSFDSLSFSTPLAVIGNATAGSEIRLPEDTDNGSNYVAIKAPDTIASNLTLTLPSADGTSGQVLQTNGSGVLSFSSPSADFVLLASTDASASASVSFDGYFTSTYKNYKLIISNALVGSNTVTGRIRFKTGSTYQTASYSSGGDGIYVNAGGGTSSGEGLYNTSSMVIHHDYFRSGYDSYGGLNSEINIYNPLNTSAYKQIGGTTTMASNNGIWNGSVFMGTYVGDLLALSGIQFLFSSGNITSGNFKLYGIK
jgi:hypothetical protein